MIPRGSYKNSEQISFDVAIGRKIRKIRKEKNITQGMLSYKIGIDPKTLIRYEYGDLGLTCFRLNKICKALGINTSELINDI